MLGSEEEAFREFEGEGEVYPGGTSLNIDASLVIFYLSWGKNPHSSRRRGVAPHMQRAGCVAIGGVKVAERSTIKTGIGEFREKKISSYLSSYIYSKNIQKSLTSCKK